MITEQTQPLLNKASHYSPRSPVLLDVEKAETSNIRSIEQQQQQQRPHPHPPHQHLLPRQSTDSFLLLYDEYHQDEAKATPNVMVPSLSSQATATTRAQAPALLHPKLSRVRTSGNGGAAPGSAPASNKLDRPNLTRAASASLSSSQQQAYNFLPSPEVGSGGGGGGGHQKPSMKDVVRRVQSIKMGKSGTAGTGTGTGTGSGTGTTRSGSLRRPKAMHQRRRTASAAEMLQAMGGGGDTHSSAAASDNVNDNNFAPAQNPAVAQAFQHHNIAPLFSDVMFNEGETEDDTVVEDEEEDEPPENHRISLSVSPSTSDPYYGSLQVSESRESLMQDELRSSVQRRHLKHHHSQRSRLRKLQQLCSPLYLIRMLVESARHSWVWAAIPFAVTAWVLYYVLGNPGLDFLPGNARLSWWCNFIARQIVTLELARLTSLVLCELVMTRGGVRCLGSHIVFFCLQAAGWPFLVTWWGIWDLLLLHGDKTFQSHWLHWTHWRIYSVANSGTYILSSDFYLRILVSMIIMGTATAVKRVVLATRFGNAQLAEFKPKLEKILQDAVIVSEVALIAQEAAAMSGEVSSPKDASTHSELGSLLPRVRLGSVTFTDDDVAVDHDDDGAPVRNESAVDSQSAMQTPVDSRASKIMMESSVFIAELEEVDCTTTAPSPTIQTPAYRPSLARTSSGNFRIKEQLERWEEPPTNSAKTVKASTHDVLKFQRVLRSIDATYPFGEEFGPCATRNDCIQSSHDLYCKLMLLSPHALALPFATISLGAVDEDGKIDEAKYKAFHRVFRPDANNELPLTYFIQSIDSVFKSLLFFRASVRNNSVIDNVLERIINGIFYFIMLLLLLSFMQLNPWPLLVSLTSLLVSVSFALGSSVSKYVEGLSLIAFRRPFDLGDRIIVLAPEATDNHNPLVSWFVEDINLFSITLRAARTNEVATVSNSSIAGARIVNLNRSTRAIVSFEVKAKICVLEGDTLSNFVEALEKYVSEHPRIWDSLLYCRTEVVDGDLEQVVFAIGFRHRNSWQDAGRIMLNRGDLVAYVYKVAKDMGISYDTPPSRSLLYGGGVLVQGQVQDYKSNLLSPLNIRSHAEMEKPHLRDRSYLEVVDPLQG